MKATLLTGGGEKHYQLGLLSGLISNHLEVDFIGNDEMKEAESYPGVHYYNLRGDQNHYAAFRKKAWRILRYYLELVRYAAKSDSRLFHIQWLNKFVYFDRTVLNLYYKALGKKLIFTAHNLNAGERDEKDSLLNGWTLKFMYKIVDHVVVHTLKMKLELMDRYHISGDKISVIPHGLNTAVFESEMTSKEAKSKLGLKEGEKTLLYFGQIAAYKGLEHLISALAKLKAGGNRLRLVIAGRVRKGDEIYWANIKKAIKEYGVEKDIIEKLLFIPDEEIEIYFKAADVLILPYKSIFQSGVVFLSYRFGLPIIASDVGSLKEDIMEGITGYIFQPEDVEDLGQKIDQYFQSELFLNLEANRPKIMQWASERYSWNKIGEKTRRVYESLLGNVGTEGRPPAAR
jgi:D-inositol-3-phosphate glycosyltransferase